jgi:muramoyltetrapeptide carboxypeptidase LdcA involved in peptidoglycan recycling
VDLPPYQLDDLLTHFRSAGKLEGVVGVVVGEMFHCDWRENRPEAPRTRSLEDVLERQLQPLGVPVLYKLPLGHGKHLRRSRSVCRRRSMPTRAPSRSRGSGLEAVPSG